jgi:glycosyltransferase involved in cell wall biosynthesis
VDTPSGRKIEVVALADPKSAASIINQYYVPEYKLDLIIGFMDAFGIEFLNDVNVPVIGWIPIDGDFTETWANYVRNFYKVIAYSKFGYRELQKWLPPSKVDFISHAVSEEFQPLDRDEVREEFSKLYGIPKDAFLAVNVGANMGPRKELPLLMRTFAKWAKDKKAYLFLHTNAYQLYPAGYDLVAWRRMVGGEKNILFPKYNPIISPVSNSLLARVYNAADIYVQNSVAEGFGLPIVESMACGTPAIVPDNSAQRELVRAEDGEERGWLVESVPEEMYVQVPVYVPQLPTYPVPNQLSLREKLDDAYNNPDKRRRYAERALKYVKENHSFEVTMDGWFRVLDEAQDELELFKALGSSFRGRS